MTSASTRWLTADDMPRWDAFVERHPLGLIYHSSRWKDALERAFSHIEGHVLAACDSGGEITAGLPLYTVKSWLLGTRVVSIPFAALCDPLVSSAEQYTLMLPQVWDLHRRAAARAIELRAVRQPHLVARAGGTVSQHYKHHYLQLGPDPEALRPGFSKTAVRQMITKAERAGLRVERGTTDRDLQRFYDLYATTRRRLCLPPIPCEFFRALWNCLGTEQMLVLLAFQGEELLAGILVLKSQALASLEHTGESASARSSGASQLLYWKAIQEASRDGCRAFSFGRTAPTHQGLIEYKRRWGTIEEDLPVFALGQPASEQPSAREASSAYRLAKHIAGLAPMPLFQMMGRFCYSHWG